MPLHGTEDRSRPPGGFADRLRERTRALHARAERTGVVGKILRGEITRQSYALYLRNLLPAYDQLETSLDFHRRAPGVRRIANSAIYRSEAIESDLRHLAGPDWRAALAVLPEAAAYRRQIAQAAAGRGETLIAHAYTRYLGDLNGGQVIKRQLMRSLNLGSNALSFYAFPALSDLPAMRTEYRSAIDLSGNEISAHREVLREASRAFELNIAVSVAVDRIVAGRRAGRTL